VKRRTKGFLIGMESSRLEQRRSAPTSAIGGVSNLLSTTEMIGAYFGGYLQE